MSCLDWPRPRIEYAMEEVPDTSRTPSPQFRCGSNFEDEIPISWEECNTQQFRKIQTRFFFYNTRISTRIFIHIYVVRATRLVTDISRLKRPRPPNPQAALGSWVIRLAHCAI